jgi:hypothetical protein
VGVDCNDSIQVAGWLFLIMGLCSITFIPDRSIARSRR